MFRLSTSLKLIFESYLMFTIWFVTVGNNIRYQYINLWTYYRLIELVMFLYSFLIVLFVFTDTCQSCLFHLTLLHSTNSSFCTDFNFSIAFSFMMQKFSTSGFSVAPWLVCGGKWCLGEFYCDRSGHDSMLDSKNLHGNSSSVLSTAELFLASSITCAGFAHLTNIFLSFWSFMIDKSEGWWMW